MSATAKDFASSLPRMGEERTGGLALILGSIGGIVTMALHPTGHDLLAPGAFDSVARLNVAVHALAIASLPVSFFGALALARRVATPDRLSIGALVVFGYAAVAALIAAATSGFVAPAFARGMLDASATVKERTHALLDYNAELNQAFAKIFTVGSSAAIALWSIAILRTRALASGIGLYGLLLGPAAIVGIVSGHLRLNVHGMGLVMFGQAIWFILVGILLCRGGERGPIP